METKAAAAAATAAAAAAAAALKQRSSNATQWISFYKLIDDLFGKISAARHQMALPAITRHLLQVPND
jgi:hypothetical protein